MNKILIALDIDGTLTDHPFHIPNDVINYLEKLYNEGISLLFVTGRTFEWGVKPLKEMPFPYFLSVQNGAILIEMPKKNILSKKYLSKNILTPICLICENEKTDVVVYSGMEHADECYYRPDYFSSDLLKYVQARCKGLMEHWIPLNSFDKLPFQNFPSAKCIAEQKSCLRIAEKIKSDLQLHIPVISDPFDRSMGIAQMTLKDVDKGQAISDFLAYHPGDQYTIIAAGDDYNDLPMLLRSDVAVAMNTAPEPVQRAATVIADQGIIKGLEKAMEMI
ncbi:Cof-type HAD-IIB family hydrolase [Chlamydiales bacterium]|nr:Cof-type HAD-IIB family hydrolase [Chlamydiales bacterium]